MPDWTDLLRRRPGLPGVVGDRRERMIQELADHLEDMYQEALHLGATEEEAEAQAIRSLSARDSKASGAAQGAHGHLAARAPRWRRSLWTAPADLVRDFRFALRSLSRRPLFTGVVVLVLSLGIGATTAIFTLLDAIVLSPLPFNEADRLVVLGHSAPNVGEGDVGQCAAWHFTYEDENRVFEDLGMYGSGAPTVLGVGEPETVPALYVTSGVFRALRMTPLLGRIFTPEDEDPGAPALVILSYGYWQNQFGGDPEVLGRTIEVSGLTREIVGVMPPTLVSLGRDPSLIIPLRFDRSTLFVGNVGYDSVVRLKDGVTMEEAAADMARMLPMAFEKFPGGPVIASAREAETIPLVRPLKTVLVGSVSNLLWVLLGGVAVVLLIACANVANLCLVRADGKTVEMAVRAAMGAGRRRIVWEYLKESLLLGVLGGAGGLVIAVAGLRILVATAPVELPRLQEVSLDPRVLLFTLTVAVGAGLLFGMFPALRQGRSGLVDALKQGGPSGIKGRDRHRVQNTLAVSQVALALLLLLASGLMLRSSQALRTVDPGFRQAADVLTLGVFLTAGDSPNAEDRARVQEQIARRLGEIPGVTSVGMATAIPMAGGNNINPLYVEGITSAGEAPPQTRRHNYIGAGYLETLQIHLRAGRSFTWQDIHNRIPAALVSENLAREYWGSVEEAMGKKISVRPDPVRWHEIIGVVADVRDDGVDTDPVPMVYWPQVTLAFWQGSPVDQAMVWRGAGYAIRSARVGTPGCLEQVREAVWEVNPNLPVRNPRTLDGLVAASVARTSFTFILLGIAAGVALLLGLIGVYGVITYAVSQRQREMGMRIALGARGQDVTGMVLRQGMVLALVGLPIGLAMAVGLTRLMSGLLYGVSALDPVTFVVVPVGLLLVTLLASYVPARRAARIDPMAALRAE
jgi:predicted permease